MDNNKALTFYERKRLGLSNSNGAFLHSIDAEAGSCEGCWSYAQIFAETCEDISDCAVQLSRSGVGQTRALTWLGRRRSWLHTEASVQQHGTGVVPWVLWVQAPLTSVCFDATPRQVPQREAQPSTQTPPTKKPLLPVV